MAMVTEAARVAAVDDDGYAWVETQRKAVCNSCSVQKGCGTGVLSKLLSNRRTRVRVLNTLGAAVGDDVVIGIEDGLLVRASVAVYFMPLVWMLLGAIAGGMLADSLQWTHAEGASTLGGMLGLAAGFWWLRRYARIAAQDESRQPSLLRFAEPEAAQGRSVIIRTEEIGRRAAGDRKPGAQGL